MDSPQNDIKMLEKLGYTECKLLGSGSFGNVFLAYNGAMQLRAVKVLLQKEFSQGEQDASIALSQTVCPYIIQIYDMIQQDNKIILEMEYANSKSLEQIVEKKKPLPEAEAKRLIVQILKGLQVFHNLHLIHRDIKPDNILLHKQSPESLVVCKISDFGLAKKLITNRMKDTQCGTPLYMAPEIYVEDKQFTEKVDVWATGVIMYQLLTGRHPFPAQTPGQLLKMLTHSPPPITSCSRLCWNFVSALLNRNPSLRLSCTRALQHPFLASKSITIPTTIRQEPPLSPPPSSPSSHPPPSPSAPSASSPSNVPSAVPHQPHLRPSSSSSESRVGHSPPSHSRRADPFPIQVQRIQPQVQPQPQPPTKEKPAVEHPKVTEPTFTPFVPPFPPPPFISPASSPTAHMRPPSAAGRTSSHEKSTAPESSHASSPPPRQKDTTAPAFKYQQHPTITAGDASASASASAASDLSGSDQPSSSFIPSSSRSSALPAYSRIPSDSHEHVTPLQRGQLTPSHFSLPDTLTASTILPTDVQVNGLESVRRLISFAADNGLYGNVLAILAMFEKEREFLREVRREQMEREREREEKEEQEQTRKREQTRRGIYSPLIHNNIITRPKSNKKGKKTHDSHKQGEGSLEADGEKTDELQAPQAPQYDLTTASAVVKDIMENERNAMKKKMLLEMKRKARKQDESSHVFGVGDLEEDSEDDIIIAENDFSDEEDEEERGSAKGAASRAEEAGDQDEAAAQVLQHPPFFFTDAAASQFMLDLPDSKKEDYLLSPVSAQCIWRNIPRTVDGVSLILYHASRYAPFWKFNLDDSNFAFNSAAGSATLVDEMGKLKINDRGAGANSFNSSASTSASLWSDIDTISELESFPLLQVTNLSAEGTKYSSSSSSSTASALFSRRLLNGVSDVARKRAAVVKEGCFLFLFLLQLKIVKRTVCFITNGSKGRSAIMIALNRDLLAKYAQKAIKLFIMALQS